MARPSSRARSASRLVRPKPPLRERLAALVCHGHEHLTIGRARIIAGLFKSELQAAFRYEIGLEIDASAEHRGIGAFAAPKPPIEHHGDRSKTLVRVNRICPMLDDREGKNIRNVSIHGNSEDLWTAA